VLRAVSGRIPATPVGFSSGRPTFNLHIPANACQPVPEICRRPSAQRTAFFIPFLFFLSVAPDAPVITAHRANATAAAAAAAVRADLRAVNLIKKKKKKKKRKEKKRSKERRVFAVAVMPRHSRVYRVTGKSRGGGIRRIRGQRQDRVKRRRGADLARCEFRETRGDGAGSGIEICAGTAARLSAVSPARSTRDFSQEISDATPAAAL